MKKIIGAAFLLAAVIVFCGVSPARAQPSCFIMEPYVAQIDHESAMVLWVTPPESGPGVFVLKTDNEIIQKTLTTDTLVPPFRDLDIGDLALVRQSVVLVELDAYQIYHYEVMCEDGSASSSGSFKTARFPGKNAPFDFVVMSDIHANYGFHGPVAEAVGKLSPDFILHTGDLIGQWGEYWSNWLEVFEVGRPYFKNTAFLTVVGNHDIDPAGNFRFLFGYNDPELTRDQEDSTQTFYSFHYGNMHVIVLDFHTQRRNLEPQLAWLKSELESSTADWVVVSFHDSMLSVGGREMFRMDILLDYALLILEHEVDLVFFGHDHIYERLIPIGSEGKKPVHFVSTNSGGHPRAVRPSPVVAGGIGHPDVMYAHVQVDGNRLKMEAILPDGTVIDRLELQKDENGIYQDEIMQQAIDLETARQIAYIYAYDHSERDHRADLHAEFGYLVSGHPDTEIVLNVPRFPHESRLIVYEQNDPSRWRSENQIVPVSDNKAVFAMQMPHNIANNHRRPEPPVELRVNLKMNGRTFEPAVIEPNISFPEMENIALIHPINLAYVSTLPEFIWKQISEESGYQVQVAVTDFPDPSVIRLDSIVADTVMAYPPHSELKPDKVYYWRVRSAHSGEVLYSITPWSMTGSFQTEESAPIDNESDQLIKTRLDQNYPNPFNTTTEIGYLLPNDSNVKLDVYDILGRHIQTLVSGAVPAGYNSITFDAKALAGGVYFYRLRAGDFTDTRYMVLVR